MSLQRADAQNWSKKFARKLKQSIRKLYGKSLMFQAENRLTLCAMRQLNNLAELIFWSTPPEELREQRQKKFPKANGRRFWTRI
jgi:hypothetical protein